MAEDQRGETIPAGDSIKVVLDRRQRASNIASNGILMATEYLGDRDPVDVAHTYVSAAEPMLSEARRTPTAALEEAERIERGEVR